MPRRLLLLVVVASSCVTTVGSFAVIAHRHQPRVRIALSAGFGASSTARKSAKKTKKKKKGLVSALEEEIQSKKESQTPQLDRFGLPPPTEESVFPALDDSVSRTPVDAAAAFNKTLVQRSIRDHLGVNLDNFDDEGLSTHRGEGTWKLNLLHCDPPVFSIDDFFTSEECREYMEMTAGDGSDDAVQVVSPTFSSTSISRRTSTTWFCRYKGVPTLLSKAQSLLNVDLSQMEEPQLVRYRTGEEFSWHYDEIPAAQLANGGQRLATLLVYLNDMDEGMGGGTIFRDLQVESKAKHGRKAKTLSVRPQAGKALLFFPAYKDGRPDVRTLHKGEVASETKKIAQLWVHERDYKASVPDNNRQEDADQLVMRENERLGFTR